MRAAAFKVFDIAFFIAIGYLILSSIAHFSEFSSFNFSQVTGAFADLRTYLYSINGIFPTFLFSTLFKIVLYTEIGMFFARWAFRILFQQGSPL